MANPALQHAQNIFSTETHLSMTERAICVVGGLALAAVAAQPRPNKLLSLAVLVVGAGLAIRGATAHSGGASNAGSL